MKQFNSIFIIFWLQKPNLLYHKDIISDPGAAVKSKAPGDSQGSLNLTTTTISDINEESLFPFPQRISKTQH